MLQAARQKMKKQDSVGNPKVRAQTTRVTRPLRVLRFSPTNQRLPFHIGSSHLEPQQSGGKNKGQDGEPKLSDNGATKIIIQMSNKLI